MVVILWLSEKTEMKYIALVLNLIMTFKEKDQEFQILEKGYARTRHVGSVWKVRFLYPWPTT